MSGRALAGQSLIEYVERLEEMLLAEDGYRCDDCQLVWDVDDMGFYVGDMKYDALSIETTRRVCRSCDAIRSVNSPCI